MLNIPNMLSIFRLCLVPVFVVAYFSGTGNANLYAVLVYALATFTDFLDGFIARRYNLITNLGKVLDPLGDKMLTFAVLACLSIDAIIPYGIVFLFLAKELLMGLGGLLIHRRAKAEIPPANIIGKTATVLFFLIGVALILFDIPKSTATLLMSIALLISLIALITYLIDYIKIMRKTKN